jgi:cytochrome c6
MPARSIAPAAPGARVRGGWPALCAGVTVAVLAAAAAALAAPPGAGTASAGADDGKQIFMQGAEPSCAVCHALSDAGATGNIGPNLDELKPDAARVRRAVKEGFGNMPSFGETLTDAQIDAVSQYVSRAAGGG